MTAGNNNNKERKKLEIILYYRDTTENSIIFVFLPSSFLDGLCTDRKIEKVRPLLSSSNAHESLKWKEDRTPPKMIMRLIRLSLITGEEACPFVF
jgi:hypothetical protein